MNTIKYTTGDATQPQQRPAAIVHVCNDAGGWGAGFVLAISKRWSSPETQYRNWFKFHTPKMRGVPQEILDDAAFKLGNITAIPVEPNLYVVNMIAQHGYRSSQNPVPLQYNALEQCLTKVFAWAKDLGISIHMPRIGAGLAGGNWSLIEAIIIKTMGDVPVTVYDFKKF